MSPKEQLEDAIAAAIDRLAEVRRDEREKEDRELERLKELLARQHCADVRAFEG